MRTLRRRLGTGLGALALASTTLIATPASAADDDLLAYVNGDDTTLRLINADGSGGRVLVDLPPADGWEGSPWPEFSWSPDGTHIAVGYLAESGYCAVTVYGVASRTSRTISTAGSCDAPTWSPDSRFLAFGEEFERLSIVAADGSSRRTIPIPDTFPQWPQWSPDGSHIAYLTSADSDVVFDLNIIGADGRGHVQLTDARGGRDIGVGSFSWDPSGDVLTYDRYDLSDNPDIWIASETGGTRRQLTSGPTRDINPAFSPDGKRIAFIRDNRLMTMDTSGGALHQVAGGPDIFGPDWSPSGDQITVTTSSYDFDTEEYHGDTYIVPAAGGQLRRLTTSGSVSSNAFSPVTPKPTPPVRGTDDSCPPARVPEDGFEDVPDTNVHESAVDCAVWWELASGVSERRFEPTRPVNRAQMATFIANTVLAGGGELPADPPDRFRDDQGLTHEHAINQLAAVGIVNGTSQSLYSPGAVVTRAQMAAFLRATYEHITGRTLPADTDYFRDDAGSVHETAINAVARAGFAGGVGPGRYAPGANVSRAQLTSFLVRVLDLLVEEGTASPPT